jgi:hypothetical protein
LKDRLAADPASAAVCEDPAALKLPHVTITAATPVPAGGFVEPQRGDRPA